MRPSILLGTIVLLAAIPAAAFIWADISDADTTPTALDAPFSQSTLQGAPSVDPEAGQGLPRDDLGRADATILFEALFDKAVASSAGVFADLDARHFYSDHVAVVEASNPDVDTESNMEYVLLDSVLPLVTGSPSSGGHRPVDLGLVWTPMEELEPANPLVALEVPGHLGEGIQLPDSGITLRLNGAPADRAPSILKEGGAFYPNVAEDSDLTVVPTPTGVETFAHLRTPEAPLAQTYDVALPPNASLNASSDGGAEVVRADQTIAVVKPPTAIDAAGNPVQVSLTVQGNTLIVTSAPTPSSTFPILVDPLLESYWWAETGNPTGLDRWTGGSNSGLFSFGLTGPSGETGLNLSSSSGIVASTAESQYAYRVPRYASDLSQYGSLPTSFIHSLKLSGIHFTLQSSANPPVARTGLRATNNTWTSLATRTGSQGPMAWATAEHNNPAENTSVKEALIQLSADGSTASDTRRLFVGSSTIAIADSDNPGFASASGPSTWVNGTPGGAAADPVVFSATDTGLGVRSVTAKIPGAGGGTAELKKYYECSGYPKNPCPRSWQGTLSEFDPKSSPQGENTLRLIATDPIYRSSPERLINVKVDRTKPTLFLSGTLTEQPKVGTGLSQYTLKYDTADGDSAAASAQTPFGTAGTGVGQLQRPMGVAFDSAGNSYVVDRECRCVQTYDASGKFVSQFAVPGSVEGKPADPRGIAVGAEGVWVTDIANAKVTLFSVTGVPLRSLSSGSLLEPYAVAIGPENALWVSDIGKHKVFKFTNATGGGQAVYGTKASQTQETPADLHGPVGLAVDSTGTVWVTDDGLSRVTAYNSSRKWVGQFGSFGSGPGQFDSPVGIALAPATGNILVAEGRNNRIQEFRPGGEFIRQYGSFGTGDSQFSEPRGIALAPDRTLLVADAGNDRITKWTHASYDPQSGVASTEIKVDGNLVEPKHSPGCATKDCAISKEWVLKADDFGIGQHTVEVTATDGVGLSTTKAMTIETHGDLTPPSVALSGTMTEQASLGATRPSYKLKVSATDPGGAEERKSGVASTTIKVDGTTVDTASPGCPAGGCSITREWTLNSSSFSAGEHSVQVIVTDAAGRVTTKSLAITIARDTTAPEIDTSNPFNTLFNRPEGWVEQKTYSYVPVVKDQGGYGVTSVVVKFDGVVKATKTQSCPQGGCEANLMGSLNMANYDGGAHTAEIVATDGAGNSRKRTWTINLTPSGQVTASEAVDTLEAVEFTAPEATELTPVESLVTEAVGEGGINPKLVHIGSEIISQDSPTPVTIKMDPEDGFGVDTVAEAEQGTIHEASIDIAPTELHAAVDEPELSDGSAAVIANTAEHVDTVLRPAYDGVMAFQAIRDSTAPGTFSWQVALNGGEYLDLINDHYAAIYWADGTQAMLIAAQPAHGADGEPVDTSLAVSEGNILTLTVKHKVPNVVYPVIAGVGWAGGYRTEEVEYQMPPEEPFANGSNGTKREQFYSSPPEWYPTEQNDPGDASVSSADGKLLKKFGARECETDLPGIYGCGVWEQKLKGFFWFVYRKKAWWTRQPECPNGGTPLLVSVSYFECEWKEPAWTKYGKGHHLTAMVLFNVTWVKIGDIDDRHLAIYAYGSGYWNDHDTDCVCNPLP